MLRKTTIATVVCLVMIVVAGGCSDDSGSSEGETDELGFTEIPQEDGDAIVLRAATAEDEEVRITNIDDYCFDYRIVRGHLEEWIGHVEAGDRDAAAALSARSRSVEDAGGRIGTNATVYTYGVRPRGQVQTAAEQIRRGDSIEDLQRYLTDYPPFEDLADFERVYEERCPG